MKTGRFHHNVKVEFTGLELTVLEEQAGGAS